MTQQLTTQPAEGKLSEWLARDDARRTITSALGGYLEPEEFLAHMLIHIQTTPATKFAPAPADCTLASQYKAIHTCATLGLLPGFQQVALIPRKNGQVYELTVMPQWQGFKALFERVPEVLEARVAVVHKSDIFDVDGDGMDIVVSRHAFNPLDPDRKIEGPADILGTYCRFSFRDGRPERYHFATTHYIQKCRGCAQTDAVWSKWFEQQALKTAFRSAYSRRVVNIDPMVQGRVEAFLRHEDQLLGNDPRIADPRIIDQSPDRAAAPVSRAALIAQQMRPQVTQASTLPTREPAERETVPARGETNEGRAETNTHVDETPDPQQTEHEQEPGPEPRGERQESGGEPTDGAVSNIDRFRAMMRSATTAKLLDSLEDSWLGAESIQELTDVERTAIKHIVEVERKRRFDAKTGGGGKGTQKRLGE